MLTIIGPGGIGGLMSGLLTRAGVENVVVARPETVAWLQRDGLTIDSDQYGKFHVEVNATTEIPVDAEVMLCIKAYGLPDVLPQLVAAKPRQVLSLLNGLSHIAPLHQALDSIAPTICGTTRVVVVRQPDHVIRHTSTYHDVSFPDGAIDWPMADALERAGVTVVRGDSENTVVWRKFHFLMGMALLTGWADEPMGPALAKDPVLTEAFLAEVASLATAEGFPVTGADIRAKLEAVNPGASSSFRTDMRAVLSTGHGQTEIETLAVEPLRRAHAHGLSVPTIERVVTDLRNRLRV